MKFTVNIKLYIYIICTEILKSFLYNKNIKMTFYKKQKERKTIY